MITDLLPEEVCSHENFDDVADEAPFPEEAAVVAGAADRWVREFTTVRYFPGAPWPPWATRRRRFYRARTESRSGRPASVVSLAAGQEWRPQGRPVEVEDHSFFTERIIGRLTRL